MRAGSWGWALSVVAVVVLSGCGELSILEHASLEESCDVATADPGIYLPRGVMDIALTNEYVAFPVVHNSTGARVQLTGMEVSFTTPPNVTFTLPQNVFIPISGAVPAEGVATTSLPLISKVIGNIIRQAPEFFNGRAFLVGNEVAVLAELTPMGVDEDGDEVEGMPFTFPLTLCVGCLVTHDPGAISEGDDGLQTCAGAEVEVGELPTPCNIGQDHPVDCRICRAQFGDPEEASAVCDPL